MSRIRLRDAAKLAIVVFWLETEALKRFIKPPNAARVLLTCVKAWSNTVKALDEESAVDSEMPATDVKELAAEAVAKTSVLAPAAVMAPFELVIEISPVTTVESVPASVRVTL